MRARRALLYTPGDDPRKIRKAADLVVDCVCLDLEDGVAISQKAQARSVIQDSLSTFHFGESERLVRINPISSGLETGDLASILPVRPDGIVVPKVTDAQQIKWVSDQITQYEREAGWPGQSICLLAIIETAVAIVRLESIAASDSRLQGLIFGSEDYAVDIGATRTQSGTEVLYARSAVVTHAAVFGLQAIDQVYTDFQNTQGLIDDALQGMHLGFSGKQVIHPNQVDAVQQVFTPSDSAIQEAIHILDIYEVHQTAGKGAFALDGKMVDAPIVKSAQRIIDRARAAGKV